MSSSDLDLIGQRFGNSMERYESVKYGVPAPVESTEGLLPFADRIDDMMDKEYAYVGDNNDLYMTSIEYDLEVGKMLSEESNSRRYELTYNVTRRSEEDQGNPPWEEEETFEVELDHAGRVVNIVNKDLDYLHDHEYVQEMVIDDGFGSGDLGLTSEDMAAINEQSVEEYFNEPINYEIGHHARQSVKQYALK